MDDLKPKGRARSGIARANALTPEKRKEIAEKAAVARWGDRPLQATHMGNFKEDFGIDVECYVLNDPKKTAVISQRGMGLAIGLKNESGIAFPRFISGKVISNALGSELLEKIDKPLIFNGLLPGAKLPPMTTHGYDVTILIDVCRAIVKAESDGKLLSSQADIAKQANIIIGASAKAGIQGLVYKLAGYDATREEVIAAFKHYVSEEAKKYEKEFPTELYDEWRRLYKITPPPRGKSWKNMHLTTDHVYYPLAKSNGELLDLLRGAKASGGDKNKKLFQFLNEIGARALRIQLGRILEMAESSPNKEVYEAKIAERFGGQLTLDLSPTYPIA